MNNYLTLECRRPEYYNKYHISLILLGGPTPAVWADFSGIPGVTDSKLDVDVASPFGFRRLWLPGLFSYRGHPASVSTELSGFCETQRHSL